MSFDRYAVIAELQEMESARDAGYIDEATFEREAALLRAKAWG